MSTSFNEAGDHPDPEQYEAQLRLLLQGLLSGDETAYREMWNLYGERLRAIARGRLPTALQNRVESSDVVQSACRSFFRRATSGELKLDDAEGLWRLLCAITLNKLRMQVRFHLRQRRTPRREIPIDSSSDAPSNAAPAPVAPGATPLELTMFAEEFEGLMTALNEDERRLVELKLNDYTNAEIAFRMGCSERTVRRLLNHVRQRWRSTLKESLEND